MSRAATSGSPTSSAILTTVARLTLAASAICSIWSRISCSQTIFPMVGLMTASPYLDIPPSWYTRHDDTRNGDHPMKYYMLNADHGVVSTNDIHEWGARFNDFASRVVAKTDVTPDVQVSTVFLGIDHGWDDGDPILFETLIFGGPLDQEMVRYTSWSDAEAGHAMMVQQVRDAMA